MYDVKGAASDRNIIVLDDIHIDIMDYIVPANCSDSEFRQMWAEFEWENKVCVHIFIFMNRVLKIFHKLNLISIYLFFSILNKHISAIN